MLWGKPATPRPSAPEEPKPEKAAAVKSLFSEVLLVVDASEASLAAARYAARLAAECKGRVTAVYVVDTGTMDYLMQMRILVTEERQEFEKDLEASGQRYLEFARTIGRNAGVEVHTQLHRGCFHKVILEVSRQLRADAIVMGGWGLRAVASRDAASSERQIILSEADCPVVVVKAEKR